MSGIATGFDIFGHALDAILDSGNAIVLKGATLHVAASVFGAWMCRAGGKSIARQGSEERPGGSPAFVRLADDSSGFVCSFLQCFLHCAACRRLCYFRPACAPPEHPPEQSAGGASATAPPHYALFEITQSCSGDLDQSDRSPARNAMNIVMLTMC